MTDEYCVFCDQSRWVARDLGNNYWYGQFDPAPTSPGHAELIPKRHVDLTNDLTRDEQESFWLAKETMEEIVLGTDLRELYSELRDRALAHDQTLPKTSLWYAERMLRHPCVDRAPDAMNGGWNDGPAAGRSIHHLHIHLIPRYQGDVLNPLGGVRAVIPGHKEY